MAVVRDMTEQKRAEETLRRNELWFRSLFEQSPIGIVIQKPDGTVAHINKACLDIFGIDHLDLDKAPRLFDENDLFKRARRNLAEGRTAEYAGPFDFSRARGGVRGKSVKVGVIYIHVLITPLFERPGEKLIGYLTQIEDVTQHQQASDRLRDLARRLVEAQESERRHIASELHDEMGQTLTGLKLTLETARRLPADAADVVLSEAQVSIGDLIARVKNLSLDLRPPMLDDLGLLPALLWHFGRYTGRTGVRVDFAHDGLHTRLASEVEIGAYRIVQEALTNVARHTTADNVKVRVFATDQAVTIEIEDHGGGFDVNKTLIGGVCSGLVGMRERAGSLGGRMTVDSTVGSGTRVTAVLPAVKRENPGDDRSR